MSQNEASTVTEDPEGAVNIQPARLYTPHEAATAIGLRSGRRAKTIAAISRAELPVVHVGPQGGVRRYLGSDLLEYIERRRRVR